jgi:hypothetical protein
VCALQHSALLLARVSGAALASAPGSVHLHHDRLIIIDDERIDIYQCIGWRGLTVAAVTDDGGEAAVL